MIASFCELVPVDKAMMWQMMEDVMEQFGEPSLGGTEFFALTPTYAQSLDPAEEAEEQGPSQGPQTPTGRKKTLYESTSPTSGSRQSPGIERVSPGVKSE